MTNLPNSFGEWLKDPDAKTIGGNGKNKYRQVFLRRLLREHLRNNENYLVKPAQWKNVNLKGSPDLRNNKHDAARYVRMKSALEYVLRSHNSGISQLGILALHLVKEAATAANRLSATRRDAFLPPLFLSLHGFLYRGGDSRLRCG
jgi:hypothetical protein